MKLLILTTILSLTVLSVSCNRNEGDKPIQGSDTQMEQEGYPNQQGSPSDQTSP